MNNRPYVDVAIIQDTTLVAYFTYYSDGGLRASYPTTDTVFTDCPQWRFTEAHSFAILAGFSIVYTVRRGPLLDERRRYINYRVN